MNYNNRFSKAINRQLTIAKKATFSLRSKLLQLNLPIDLQIDLYDKLINPIMTYGSEIWGFEDLNLLNLSHRSFLKNALRVNKYVANAIVYGETGTEKLNIKIYTRMIGF